MLPKIADGDRIVGAYAESASGPGWSNRLVWLVVYQRTGGYRLEAVQPQDQGATIRAMLSTCIACSSDLIGAVQSLYTEGR